MPLRTGSDAASHWAPRGASREAASMPRDRSNPTASRPCRAASATRSPVPVATSTTTLPTGRPRDLTVRTRHRVSSPNVITRFTVAYRGAIVSNISRTRWVFSAPTGSSPAVSDGVTRSEVVAEDDLGDARGLGSVALLDRHVHHRLAAALDGCDLDQRCAERSHEFSSGRCEAKELRIRGAL